MINIEEVILVNDDDVGMGIEIEDGNICEIEGLVKCIEDIVVIDDIESGSVDLLSVVVEFEF